NRPQPGATTLPRSAHNRGHGETLGDVVQDYGAENDRPQPARNQKAGSDGDAIEERMYEQTPEGRIGHARIKDLVRVGLFAEMEMRRPRVLEEVDDEVTDQNQQRRRPRGAWRRNSYALRDHFGQCGSQHEARTESDEIGHEGPAPRPGAHNHAAKD